MTELDTYAIPEAHNPAFATGFGDLSGHYIDTGGNNFWGVQVFQNAGQEYVAASDRDLGLYIFKYNP